MTADEFKKKIKKLLCINCECNSERFRILFFFNAWLLRVDAVKGCSRQLLQASFCARAVQLWRNWSESSKVGRGINEQNSKI